MGKTVLPAAMMPEAKRVDISIDVELEEENASEEIFAEEPDEFLAVLTEMTEAQKIADERVNEPVIEPDAKENSKENGNREELLDDYFEED